MKGRAAVALALAIAGGMATSSCAAALMKLPSNTGAVVSDAARVLEPLIRTCTAIKTLTAEVAVKGKIADRRMRARLVVGLAEPASAYIEAPAPFGAPVFVFGARNDDATLLLPR